ncbi:cell division protein FtsX [Hyphobacterium sp.]|uniref:cell division protein FtsX n=1 Tax=Hyphobacterium sp. TaxID=2004662 RepID=UPI003BABFF0C
MTEIEATKPALPKPPPGGNAKLLPPDEGRDRPLFAVAAILVFLACLAALGARGAWTSSERWMADLDQSLTVQIRPVENRDANADAQTAATLIAGLPGIEAATARDRAASEALLEPWFGPGGLPRDLPVPLLIDVEVSDPDRIDLDGLAAELRAAGIQAEIDDHGRWSDAIARASQLARLLALGLLALIVGAAAAVIAFAARASLAARRDVADALHVVGATDRYIAGLFERRFFSLGLKAGATGAVFAAAIAILVAVGGRNEDALTFLPAILFAPYEIAALLAAPVIAGVIAALSARLAVEEELRNRW